MNKYNSRLLAICHTYILSIFLGIILWIPFPKSIHFFGASSVFYAFLLAVSRISSALTFFSITWIVLFSIGIVACFLIARVSNYYKPFICVIVIELAVSLVFLIIKLSLQNYADLLAAFIGLIMRILFFFALKGSETVYLKQAKRNKKPKPDEYTIRFLTAAGQETDLLNSNSSLGNTQKDVV